MANTNTSEESAVIELTCEDRAAQHELNEQAMERIRAEVKELQPLLSDIEDFSFLEAQYSDQLSLNKVQELKSRYKGMRRVRGDGDCFIRAYIFGYLEQLLLRKDQAQMDAFSALLRQNLDATTEFGYDREFVSGFVLTLIHQVNDVRNGILDRAGLAARFHDMDVQSAVIFSARLLTSCYLQQNSDMFQPFIEDGRSIKEFCLADVEPMGVEVEQLQIIAMTQALKVGVRIEYLDLSQGGLNHHDFPEDQEPVVWVLYRPGHYDILYI